MTWFFERRNDYGAQSSSTKHLTNKQQAAWRQLLGSMQLPCFTGTYNGPHGAHLNPHRQLPIAKQCLQSFCCERRTGCSCKIVSHTCNCNGTIAGKPQAESVKDDPETNSYNVQEVVDDFVEKAQEWQDCVQGEQCYLYITCRAAPEHCCMLQKQ